MDKQEFLVRLRNRLSALPQNEREERLSFYSERIDDRMEEGLSEEDAVAEVGAAEDIVGQITAEKPKQKRKMSTSQILLIILGAPLWLPLLIAAVAVVVFVYVSLWSVVISLWATFASLVACGAAGMFVGAGFVVAGNVLSGGATIAAGAVCAGVAVFLFFGCKATTRFAVWIGKKSVRWLADRVLKEEAA